MTRKLKPIANVKFYRKSDIPPWARLSFTPPFSSYTQKELFEIVADVASYNRFVPFCAGSRIINPPKELHVAESHSPLSVMEAELTVGFLGFREKYVSQVTFTPYQSVQVFLLHLHLALSNQLRFSRQLHLQPLHCSKHFQRHGDSYQHLPKILTVPSVLVILKAVVTKGGISRRW